MLPSKPADTVDKAAPATPPERAYNAVETTHVALVYRFARQKLGLPDIDPLGISALSPRCGRNVELGTPSVTH